MTRGAALSLTTPTPDSQRYELPPDIADDGKNRRTRGTGRPARPAPRRAITQARGDILPAQQPGDARRAAGEGFARGAGPQQHGPGLRPAAGDGAAQAGARGAAPGHRGRPGAAGANARARAGEGAAARDSRSDRPNPRENLGVHEISRGHGLRQVPALGAARRPLLRGRGGRALPGAPCVPLHEHHRGDHPGGRRGE